MTEHTLSNDPLPVDLPTRPSTKKNILRYILRRTAVLFVTVIVAVYLTIIIANYGGFVDEIIRSQIDLALLGRVQAGWLSDVPVEERAPIIEQAQEAMAEAAGLNDPFLLRTFRWLANGLTLDWGESARPRVYRGGTYATEVRQIILDHITRTLFVFGTAYLLLFFASVFVALLLNRKYGSWLDKFFVTMSPLSSAPAWIYGIILSFLFLRLFTLSSGGTFDSWPDEFQLSYVPILLRHLFLPLLAIFLSGLLLSVNTWRTFFLIYSGEDYVEMAKARGLSPRKIEWRYILRPALPGLITSFALMTMVLWQEIIAIEYFFNVAGIGRVFISALRALDTPMIVGLTVTFAYILVFTVFILDIVYSLVDPRVRIGGDNLSLGGVSGSKRQRLKFWRARVKSGSASHAPAQLSGSAVSQQKRPWPFFSLSVFFRLIKGSLTAFVRFFKQLAEYPAALVGVFIILIFIGISIYTIVTIPYDDAIAMWRGEDNVWNRNPRDALPTWVNYFRLNDLPPNITMDNQDPAVSKQVNQISEEMTEITISFPFNYEYGDFPQDIVVYLTSEYDEKLPHVTLTWLPPAGEEVRLTTFSLQGDEAYYLSHDERLQRRLDSQFPQRALFTAPEGDTAVVMPGEYELLVSAIVFEEGADVDAEFVMFGQVHGLAGTDAKRRDLSVALLWGTPVALAFGLVAAVITSFLGMFFAALGTWFGGWLDGLIQFITEVNLILPFFAVSLMIFTLYSKSIWVILGVTILLSIFGHSVKTYRATFLQIKEAPYIEAAQAYGAKDGRIITRYLIPRIMPILIPKLIILVPSFVFLEATLAFLGVSDPVLPTWGKLIVDGLSSGIHRGVYHVVLLPLSLLLLIGFAFAVVGLSLEKLFEPRLRDR